MSHIFKTSTTYLVAERNIRNTNKFIYNWLSSLIALSAITCGQFVLANPAGIEAFENGDWTLAERLFKESLEIDENDAVAYQYLGNISLERGELDDAEMYLEEAVILAPTSAAIQFDYSQVLAEIAESSSVIQAMSSGKKMLAALQKAVELSPRTITYRLKLIEFYLIAPAAFGGSTELAMAEAEAIAEVDEVQGVLATASVYQSSDDDDELIALYASAEEKFPNNAQITFSRAMYFRSKAKYELAYADLLRIPSMEVEPGDDTKLFALFQIGRTSVISNTRPQDGIEALEIYVSTTPETEGLPNKAVAKYQLGQLYVRVGDNAKAIEIYEQARTEIEIPRILSELESALEELSEG